MSQDEISFSSCDSDISISIASEGELDLLDLSRDYPTDSEASDGVRRRRWSRWSPVGLVSATRPYLLNIMDPSELFSVYVLLVSSKEVLVSSPEVEARIAAVYGKGGLDRLRACRECTADMFLMLVVCQDINRIRICSRSLELPGP